MELTAPIAKIKAVKVEPAFLMAGRTVVKSITRVIFNDGHWFTFQGELSKKAAYYQGYLLKALEAGMNSTEAEQFAAAQYPVPMRKGA